MIDAERAVLGACLVDPQAYWKVADVLVADDFSTGDGRGLFGAIAALIRDGVTPDPTTLAERNPQFAAMAYDVAGSDGWRTANVRAYAEQVAAKALARRVKVAGDRIAKLPDPDAYGEAQRILATCAPKATTAVRHIRDWLRDSVAALQSKFEAGGKSCGLETSIPALDGLTSGWQRGDLIIIAARPSVGKTAFAVQAAIHAAKHVEPVLFFSLEMSGVQVADRVQSHIARVDSRGLRDPSKLDEADFARLFDAASSIADMPLHIDDSSALTVEAVAARARQVNASHRLGLIVIDYLTQMMPPKAQTVTEAVQLQTRALKALAKDLQVPILLLSQLNRTGDSKPSLTSLRDSGAIEQDADVVIFLHRPDPANHNHIELIVGKQRNGPIGDVWLYADYAHSKFIESEPPAVEARPRGFGRRVA